MFSVITRRTKSGLANWKSTVKPTSAAQRVLGRQILQVSGSGLADDLLATGEARWRGEWTAWFITGSDGHQKRILPVHMSLYMTQSPMKLKRGRLKLAGLFFSNTKWPIQAQP